MTLVLPIASHWQKILHPGLAKLTGPLPGWFYTILPHGDLAVSLVTLLLLGFSLGLLSGLFGGASGFCLAPVLNFVANIPYNVAVGTEVSLLVGTATVANLRQRGRAVDYKLGLFLLLGGCVGLEAGARLLQLLTSAGALNLWGRQISLLQIVMTLVYGSLLCLIGSYVYRQARRLFPAAPVSGLPEPPPLAVTSKLVRVTLPPLVALPQSGIEAVSLWLILAVGAATGFLTGFLGVSGSLIRIPALIYLLGIPALIALDTNLFDYLLLALYGAFTHSLNGNVDLVLLVILLLTTIPGSQCGLWLRPKLSGPRLQLAFAAILGVMVIIMVLKVVI
jgi:uncharacterized protein